MKADCFGDDRPHGVAERHEFRPHRRRVLNEAVPRHNRGRINRRDFLEGRHPFARVRCPHRRKDVIREDFAREEDLLRGQVDLQVAALCARVRCRRRRSPSCPGGSRASTKTVSAGTICFGPPRRSFSPCVRSEACDAGLEKPPPMMGTRRCRPCDRRARRETTTSTMGCGVRRRISSTSFCVTAEVPCPSATSAPVPVTTIRSSVRYPKPPLWRSEKT